MISAWWAVPQTPLGDITTLFSSRGFSSSSLYLFSDNNTTQKITKIAIQIGGLPEKPYSSLTGRPSKKINCPQIILSYNQNTNKKQHCAGAIGHEQYHHFIYNNHNRPSSKKTEEKGGRNEEKRGCTARCRGEFATVTGIRLLQRSTHN